MYRVDGTSPQPYNDSEAPNYNGSEPQDHYDLKKGVPMAQSIVSTASMSQEAKTAIGNLIREAIEGKISQETLEQMGKIPEKHLPKPWGHIASITWGWTKPYQDELADELVDEIRILCLERQGKL